MTPTDTEKVTKIIVDMLMEFQKEHSRIQSSYDNGILRLNEIQEDLTNYRETEDVDFKVFSPRKVSMLNEDKLNSMDNEMRQIEEVNKGLLKQLKYYSDKVEKLLTVQAILDGEIYEVPVDKEDSIEDIFDIKKKDEDILLDNDIENNEKSSSDLVLPEMNEYDKQSLVDNLERLSHRIEVGSKIIDSDVYRTKMELKSIKSGLDDVISTLK